MTRDNVLFQNWYLLGVKNILNHAHKTWFLYLLGVLLKSFDKQVPPSFSYGVPLSMYSYSAET